MFIHDHVADFPVQVMCELLGVSRGGYCAWAGRAESARAADDRTLAAEIRAAYEASRGRYGSPRVHAELRARGRRIGRKRVARLMRGMGLAARKAPVPADDGQQARLPDRAQPARAQLHGGGARPGLAGRPDLHLDGAGLAVSRCGARSLHPPSGGLGHGRPSQA